MRYFTFWPKAKVGGDTAEWRSLFGKEEERKWNYVSDNSKMFLDNLELSIPVEVRVDQIEKLRNWFAGAI